MYRWTIDARADDDTDAAIVAEVLAGAIRDERNDPAEPVGVTFRDLAGGPELVLGDGPAELVELADDDDAIEVAATSGYHDELADAQAREVGAWRVELGRLPDGRYAVDHYSAAAPRKQRLYFDELDAAVAHFGSWGATCRLPS